MSSRQEQYYRIAAKASLNREHPAVVAIERQARIAKNILDLGCGEGTRLGNLKTKGKKVGVDINSFAINKAQKKYPAVKFIKADIEKLPFRANTFDLVYSMFVIEHTDNPEKLIKEAARVLKKGGSFILGAPNYGSPNRRSPNSKENKFSKLIKDFLPRNKSVIDWTRVEPSKGKYFIDADTKVEPYIGSLIIYLKKLGLTVQKASSLWEIDEFSFKQLPFRVFGLFKIPPFVWWGPQIFIIAKK